MIVYCCQDLIFATKIRSTAQAVGLTSAPACDVATLTQQIGPADDPNNGQELVTGVLVDLTMDRVALELIQQAKAQEPDLPVVAFGWHGATEQLQAARDAGADLVMPRSQLAADLPAILERYSGNTT